MPVCAACAARPPAFDRLRAPYVYGGPLVELIVAAKFRGREDLADAAARLVARDREAQQLIGAAASLVPVPLGRRRRRQRGYNQAAIMARVLSRAWGKPVTHALERKRDTDPQSDLPKAARRDNVAGAFVAPRVVRGALVLVDDVVTSAETAHAAAAALKTAGATEVMVVSLARAMLDG